MRTVIGMVSLLLVLAVVGLLAKKQLASTRSAVLVQPAGDMPGAGAAPAASVRMQGQQVQQQVKEAVEGLMQQPLPHAGRCAVNMSQICL